MANLTAVDVRKLILKSIKRDFGMTFTELKKKMLKTVEHGSSNHFDSKQGYKLFYTSNKNFASGGKNGGAGYFAILLMPNKLNQTIKLAEK